MQMHVNTVESLTSQLRAYRARNAQYDELLQNGGNDELKKLELLASIASAQTDLKAIATKTAEADLRAQELDDQTKAKVASNTVLEEKIKAARAVMAAKVDAMDVRKQEIVAVSADVEKQLQAVESQCEELKKVIGELPEQKARLQKKRDDVLAQVEAAERKLKEWKATNASIVINMVEKSPILLEQALEDAEAALRVANNRKKGLCDEIEEVKHRNNRSLLNHPNTQHAQIKSIRQQSNVHKIHQ